MLIPLMSMILKYIDLYVTGFAVLQHPTVPLLDELEVPGSLHVRGQLFKLNDK